MDELKQDFWSKTKLLVKVGVIAGIIGLLMIPTCQVEQLVMEREATQKAAVSEVSSKWAGRQVLAGPVLVVPFREAQPDGKGGTTYTRRQALFLPDTLNLQAAADPQERHRGIYKVLLYSSVTRVEGQFAAPDLQALGVAAGDMLWNEAFLRIGLSDVRGLEEEVRWQWNGRPVVFHQDPAAAPDSIVGFTAAVPLGGLAELSGARFSGSIAFGGSQQLLFAPLARKASLSLRSSWPHPSFTGDALPAQTAISDKGFAASWRIAAARRGVPQQLVGDDVLRSKQYAPEGLAVGVDLFVPVNGYQKTLRSIKYALLCIVLTFAAFFIMETISKRPAHPFQYGLIGLALVLFYALLLSFSEYIGFNPAYAVASLATVALICWFVRGILGSGRLTIVLSVVLVLLYGFVFTTLQLQDYSLLLGSIALFATLAVIMYFSRKLNW